MSQRFFMNGPLQVGHIILSGAEAHHLATVCRLRKGQHVYLFNGDGYEYQVEIVAVDKKQVELDVLEVQKPERELPFQLTVACPLPKGERGHWLIEKLTEIGVKAYIPLQTKRSVIQVKEKRLQKLRQYVIEASKQCGRCQLMEIEPQQEWQTLAQLPGLPKRRWFAQPGGQWIDRQEQQADTILACGPEGGWSDAEVQLASEQDWQLVDLGPRTLRIETAAVLMASWVV